jgi:hypothetical protein
MDSFQPIYRTNRQTRTSDGVNEEKSPILFPKAKGISKEKIVKRTQTTLRAALLAIVGLLPAIPASAATQDEVRVHKEGVELIRQLESVARNLRYNAGHLQSFTGTILVSGSAHTHRLSEIRNLMNERVRPLVARLVEIQPQLPEWKQQTIESMIEAALSLKTDTSSAILSMRNSSVPGPLTLNAEYKELISKIYEHADRLVRTTDAAGNYAAARLRASEAGLSVPQS